jgi:hypothetical protein
MGYWGEGLLANDDAGDLTVFWEDFILPLRRQDPDTWTPDHIADFFSYFRPFRPAHGKPQADEAAEVLALGALYRRHRMEIPPQLRLRLVEAANAELESDRLQEWAIPGKRRRVLIDFLRSIGGEIHASKDADSVPSPGSLKEQIEQFERFIPHLARWIPVLKGPSPDDEFNAVCPPFLDRLAELLATPRDEPVLRQQEITKYRLMMYAWFLGCVLRLPDEDIVELIERAERTDGQLPFAILP